MFAVQISSPWYKAVVAIKESPHSVPMSTIPTLEGDISNLPLQG